MLFLFFFSEGRKRAIAVMCCLLHYKCRERNVTNIRYSNLKKYPFLFRLIRVFLKKDVAGELH